MKKLIVGLEKDSHVYVFAVLGLIMIIFPAYVGKAVPYMLGIGMLVFGALKVMRCLRYQDSSVSLGGGVIRIVTGVILLLQKAESIGIIGVIWAMFSLLEVAHEIDEYRETKKIGIVSLISIPATILLAAMLMMDPFAHFNSHVRILGLEIISAALVRRKKKRIEKPEGDTTL